MDANDNEKDEKTEVMSGDELELNQLASYAKNKPRFSVPNEESDQSNMKCERSKSLISPQDLDGFDPIRKRISSILSLGEWGGALYSHDSLESLKNGKW